MGVYDILVDGDRSEQVKCWDDLSLKIIHVGDLVPTWMGNDTYTIILPGLGSGFALIVNGVFKGITGQVKNTFEPYVTKWGDPTDLTVDQDEQNPILKAMKALLLSEDEE